MPKKIKPPIPVNIFINHKSKGMNSSSMILEQDLTDIDDPSRLYSSFFPWSTQYFLLSFSLLISKESKPKTF